MKKINRFTLLPILAMTLVGCGGGGGDSGHPTSAFEKVSYAFTGVENSFSNKSTGGRLSRARDIDSGLSAIDALFTSEDSKGDNIEDLDYYQAPMIQFQCLKTVVGLVGTDYQFGNKYYNTIDGIVYFNPQTGEKIDSPNQKDRYDYSFIIGVEINIDSNDLITGDVSFDITLTKDEEVIHTEWYCRMELDYDMDKSTPNYEMTMWTANDQKALPFRNNCTYEYDYVKVVNNSFNEWRKFSYSSNIKLLKDEQHPNMDSYLNEGLIYEINACKWYKNHNMRVIKHASEDRERAILKACFDNMGLNATDINGNPFISKQGIQHNAIKVLYSQFTSIFRFEFIYALITHSDSGAPDPDKEIAGIVFRLNVDEGFDNHIVKDNSEITIGDLFDQSKDCWANVNAPHVYYLDQYGGVIEEATDLSVFDVQFILNGNTQNVSFSDKLEPLLQSVFEENIKKLYNFQLKFILKSNTAVNATLNCAYEHSSESQQDDRVITSINFINSQTNESYGLTDLYEDSTLMDFLTSMHYDPVAEEDVYEPKLVYLDQYGDYMGDVSYAGGNYSFSATFWNSKISEDVTFEVTTDQLLSDIYLAAVSSLDYYPCIWITFTIVKDNMTASFEIRFLYGDGTPFEETITDRWPIEKFEAVGFDENTIPPELRPDGKISGRLYEFSMSEADHVLMIRMKTNSDAIEKYLYELGNRYGYQRFYQQYGDYPYYIKYLDAEYKTAIGISAQIYDSSNGIYELCFSIGEGQTTYRKGITQEIRESAFADYSHLLLPEISTDYWLNYINYENTIYFYDFDGGLTEFKNKYVPQLTSQGFTYEENYERYSVTMGKEIFIIYIGQNTRYNPLVGHETTIFYIMWTTFTED